MQRSSEAAKQIADGRGTLNDCGRCGECSTSAAQGHQNTCAAQKPQEGRNQIGRQFLHLVARVWCQLNQRSGGIGRLSSKIAYGWNLGYASAILVLEKPRNQGRVGKPRAVLGSEEEKASHRGQRPQKRRNKV